MGKRCFFKFNLSVNSIDNIATVEAKADEQGILDLARVLNVPVRFFSPEELDRAGSVPTPSEVVKKHMGVASICEAAAILASNQGKLLVPKQVMKNVTVAVGLRPLCRWNRAGRRKLSFPTGSAGNLSGGGCCRI
jgi:cobalt-precorrin 5A hydrolase